MARKKHLINIHTSTGTTAPTSANLYLGEIAVQHTSGDTALWIKVGSSNESNVYEKFIGETKITEMISGLEPILGSGYTYSGIPYVNSATSIADAYSALTKEVLDNEYVVSMALNDLRDDIEDLSGNTEFIDPLSAAVISLSAGVKSNEYVVSTALNDLNARVDEISGNTGGGGGDVSPLSAAVISLSAAVVTISGSSGGGGDITPLSSATYSHVTNNDIHVAASDKTAWNSNTTAITALSAATTAHTSNANIHVPTGGTNGQFLSLVNGSPTWTDPIIIYTGQNPPASILGKEGDIYIETS